MEMPMAPQNTNNNLATAKATNRPISPEDQELLEELKLFAEQPDNASKYPAITKLLKKEQTRISKGIKSAEDEKYIDLESGKPTRLTYKVLLPIEKYPHFNYVGRILGPKGATLRGMQEISGCKLAVLGKGSMRDKSKEEQCRLEGGKYSHLDEPLQVWMQAFGTPEDAFYKLHVASKEVKKYLQADYNDEIFTEQMAMLEQMGGSQPKSVPTTVPMTVPTPADTFDMNTLSVSELPSQPQQLPHTGTGKSSRGGYRGHRGGFTHRGGRGGGYVQSNGMGRGSHIDHREMRGSLRGRGMGRNAPHHRSPHGLSATAIGLGRGRILAQRIDFENLYEEIYESVPVMYEQYQVPYQNGTVENGGSSYYETSSVIDPTQSPESKAMRREKVAVS